MTDHEQKELRHYCAFLLKEYGFEFSPIDPVIPALYIIHKEMQLNNQSNSVIAAQIKEASLQINPRVFHFNSPGEAWKFQMGAAVKWLWGVTLALAFILVAAWYWSIVNDVRRAKAILETSGPVGGFLKGVSRDKVGYYVEFTAANGDSIQPFTEFRKLDARTVRVYLERESH